MATTDSKRRVAGMENVSEVYDRYGKPDVPASIVGMFAGLGTLVFLSALIAAGAAGIDFQLNLIAEDGTLTEASIVGLIVAAAVMFTAFLVGGFGAGRMSRYNGGMNGLGAGLWLILLVAIFGALGAWVGAEYNAFNQLNLPNWFAQFGADELTAMAAVAGVVLILATLAGGYVGGRLGEAYHTRVDAALAEEVRRGG
jgi:amino acid transporter